VEKMKFFLNKLVLNGAKNIDKPIELLFSNKTVSRNTDFAFSNVKAIYGPNGAGKSGIMASMYIYKRLILDNNGINDKLFSNFIYETINKDNKSLRIEIVFTVYGESDNKPLCFKHCVELGIIDDNVSIINENVSILTGKTIQNDNFRTLIDIQNGQIIELKKNAKRSLFEEPVYIYSLNLLDKYSVSKVVLKLINKDYDGYLGDSEVYNALTYILLFATDLVVEINKDDTHNDYLSTKVLEQLFDSEEKITILKNAMTSKEFMFNLSIKNADIVNERDLEKYEENIKKLTAFIKVFKPSLDEIIIDKKINDNVYYCNKIFRYGNKKIDIEFESTGIRKLVKLYNSIKYCSNGHVTFIDEMDANLHDVYFAKLIEFFRNDGKGQLCFTTHNLEPIDVLKGNSHSLDFISDDSRIYSWKKDGHNSPMFKYVNGLIPYSPFNVESFDFDVLIEED